MDWGQGLIINMPIYTVLFTIFMFVLVIVVGGKLVKKPGAGSRMGESNKITRSCYRTRPNLNFIKSTQRSYDGS